jgi:hypothetical protein
MRAHPVDVRAPHLTGERAPRRRARPLLAGVRAPLDVHAPTWQACAPYARAPLLAGVRALYTWVRAPLRRARPPPCRPARPIPTYVRALCAQTCTPPASVRALYTWVRAPLRRARPPPRRRAHPIPAYVRAPLHRRRARPTPQTCAPYPVGVCAPQQPCAPPSSLVCAPYPRRRACPPHPRARPLADVRALPPQCARPHRWWQNKIYKEGSLTFPLHHDWLCVLGLLCGLLA